MTGGSPETETQNKLFLDNEGIIRHVLRGHQNVQTIVELREGTLPLIKRLRSEGKRVLILIDLTKINSSDSAVRNESKKLLDADYDRIAIIGNAYLQPLITFALKTLGKSNNVHYYHSERDALQWLRSGETATGKGRAALRTSWLTWAIIPFLLLTIIATFVAWRQASGRVESSARVYFAQETKDIKSAIDDRMHGYTNALSGFRALFHSSDTVDEKEFTNYFRSIDLAGHYPGFDSLVFVTKVSGAERNQFVSTVRADDSLLPGGHPNFDIAPEGQRNEYFVTTFVGASHSEVIGTGIDLKTNDDRRPILEKARDSGEAAASSTIRLLGKTGEENQQRTGFNLAMPIYKDHVPKLLDDRRNEHEGFIMSVFSYGTLFDNIFRNEQQALRIQLADDTGTAIYTRGAMQQGNTRTVTIPVQIADKTFKATITAPRLLGVAETETRLPRNVLIVGTVVSTLLATLFWIQNRARGRAVTLAAEMTEDLQGERNEAVATKNKDEAILTSIGDGVFALDSRGRIALFNKAAERISGYSASEVLGKHYTDILKFIDPETKNIQDAFIREAQTGKQSSMQRHTSLVRKDGELLPVADSAAPIFNAAGEQQGIIVVFRDVTSQEKFERKLEESNERYNLVSRATSDVIYDLDVASATLEWNEALHSEYGYQLPEPKTSLEWWVGHIHPEDAMTVNESIDKALRSTDKTWMAEYRFKKADGTYIFVRDRAFIQHDEKGQPVRMIGSMLDITKQKQLEQAKDEFISLVSHQLRTPLTAIRLFTEMLADGQVGELNEGQKDYVTKVKISSERMIRLVSDILNISRIELGRVKITPKPTDANKLIQSLMDETTPIAKEKGVELHFTSNHLPEIPLDPTIFEQVVHNLLTNAIRYTKQGEGKVDISFTKEPVGFVLAVKDNGIGIPEKAKANIFNRFFRADNAISAVGEGTGLGLYLIKIIMESAGGSVRFDSTEGQGTTFYVTIPLTGMKPKGGEKSLD